MRKQKIIIAIDGYASTGKSTQAKKIAQKLDYVYIDSGAMYRAITLYAIRENILDESSISSDGEVVQKSLSDNQANPSPTQDLANLLLSKGIISKDQLQVAKKQMSLTGKVSLGEVLVNMGFLTESTLGEAISKTSGVDKFDLKSVVLDPKFTSSFGVKPL